MTCIHLFILLKIRLITKDQYVYVNFNRLERLPLQLIWHDVSRPFGMVSRKQRWKSAEELYKKKDISISDAEEVFQMAAKRASQLIDRILTLHGSMKLGITAV